MDPLTTQYVAYNKRRLHYSFLFWACMALHISGLLVIMLFASQEPLFPLPVLKAVMGSGSFPMAFIVLRLHKVEINYETHLRKIEDHWISDGLGGIQRANMTSRLSSRKVVILGLFSLGVLLFGSIWI